MSQAEHEAALLPPSRYRHGADTAHSYAARATAHAVSLARVHGLTLREPPERSEAENIEIAAQVRIIGEVFGNPFRPAFLGPFCLTSTVVSIARQMYESRDFSSMPILSDALQDAGCDNADVIDHCRGDGAHVRGCWVVDLVLGKT
ncbi:MAG: hypothetical protein JWO38_7268 [Gemmataceae bacterium]|nr:hypothetical protein [Gemmataceae bacterium]